MARPKNPASDYTGGTPTAAYDRKPGDDYTGGTPTAAYDTGMRATRAEDYDVQDQLDERRQKYLDTSVRAQTLRQYAAQGQITPEQQANLSRSRGIGATWLVNYNLRQADKLDAEWQRTTAKVDPAKNPVIHDIVVQAQAQGANLTDQDIANMVTIGDHERALHAYSDFMQKGDMIGARNMILNLQETNPVLASMVPASFEKQAGKWISENGGKWVVDQARDPNMIQNALGTVGGWLTSDSNWNPVHDLTLLWEGGQHALAASKWSDPNESVADAATSWTNAVPVLGPVLKGWAATEKGSLDSKRVEEIRAQYPTAVVDAALKLRQAYADGDPNAVVDMLMDENLDPQVANFVRDTLYNGQETATMVGKDGKEVPLGSRDLMEQILGARTDNLGDLMTTDFLQAWNKDFNSNDGYGSGIRSAVSSGTNLAASFLDPTILATGAGRLVIASRYAIAKLAPKVAEGATAAERAAAKGDIASALRSVKVAGFETNRARRYMEGFLREADRLDDLEKGSVKYSLQRERIARQYRLIPDDVAEVFINGVSKTSVGRQVDGLVVNGERVSTGLVDVIADQNELWVGLSQGVSKKAAEAGQNYLINKAIALKLLDDLPEDVVPLDVLKGLAGEGKLEALYAEKLPIFKARAEQAAAKAEAAGAYSEKASELGAAADKAADEYAQARDAVSKAKVMEEAIVGREMPESISSRLTSRTQSRDLLMPRTGVVGDLRRRAINSLFTSGLDAKRAQALVDVYLNGAVTPDAVAYGLEQNFDKIGRAERTIRGENVLPGRLGAVVDKVTRLGSTMPNKSTINIATAADTDTFYKFARQYHNRAVSTLLSDAFRRGDEGTRRNLIAATIRSGAASRGVDITKEEIATKLDELATGRYKGEAYAMQTPGAPSAIMMESTRREAEKADRLVTKSEGIIAKRNATIEKAQKALDNAIAAGDVDAAEAAQKRIDNAMDSIAKHQAKIAKQQIHFDRLENALLLSLGKKESRKPSQIIEEVPVAEQMAPPVKVEAPVEVVDDVVDEVVETAPLDLPVADGKPLTVNGAPTSHVSTGRAEIPSDGTIKPSRTDNGNWTDKVTGGYTTTVKSGNVDRQVEVKTIETRSGARKWEVKVLREQGNEKSLDAPVQFNEWGDITNTVWKGPEMAQHGYSKKAYALAAKAIVQEAEKFDIPIRGRLSEWMDKLGVKHVAESTPTPWDSRSIVRAMSDDEERAAAEWMLKQDPRLGEVYRYEDGDRSFAADVHVGEKTHNPTDALPHINTDNPRVRELLATYLGLADGSVGKAATPELRAAHEAANRLATIPNLNERVAAHPGVASLVEEFGAALKKGDQYSASILEDQIAAARREALASLADEVMADPKHRSQFLASYGLDGEKPNEEWLNKLEADYEKAGENFQWLYGEPEPFLGLKTMVELEDSNPAVMRAIEAGDYEAASRASEEVTQELRDQVMGQSDVWDAFVIKQNGTYGDIKRAREEEFKSDWMMGGGSPMIDGKYAEISNQGLQAVMDPPLPESAMKLWNEEGKISRVALHDLIQEWGEESTWSWFNTGHPDSAHVAAFADEPFSVTPKMRVDPGTGLPNVRKSAQIPGEYRQFDVGAPEAKAAGKARKSAKIKEFESQLEAAKEVGDEEAIAELEDQIYRENARALAAKKPKKSTGEYLQPPWWHKPLKDYEYVNKRVQAEFDNAKYGLEQAVEAGQLDTEIDNFVREMRVDAQKVADRDSWIAREYAAAKERMIESVRQGQDLKPLEDYVGRLERQAAPVRPAPKPVEDPIVPIVDEPIDTTVIPEDEIDVVDTTPDYTMDDINAMVSDYEATMNDPIRAANGTVQWSPSRDLNGRENGVHLYQMAKNVSIPSMRDIEAIGALRQMRAGRFATSLAQNSTDLWSLGTLYGFRFAQRSALEDLISFSLTAGLGRTPDLMRGRRASTAVRDVSPMIKVVKKADMKDGGTGLEHNARRDLRRAQTAIAKERKLMANGKGSEERMAQFESAARTAQATLDNDFVYIVPKNDPNLFFDRTSRLGMFNKWFRKTGDYIQAKNIQYIQSVILPNIDVEKLAVAHAATTHGNYGPIRELIGETLGNQRFNNMSVDDVEFIKDLMGTPAGTAIFQDFAESAAMANSANFSHLGHAADELLDIPDIEFAKPGKGVYYGDYKSLRLSAKGGGGIEDGAMMAWYRRLQAIVDDDGPIGKIAIAHLNNPEKAKKAIADAIRKDMAKTEGHKNKWGYAERWSLVGNEAAVDDFASRYYEAVLPYFLKRDNTLNWDLRNTFVHPYVDKKGAEKFKVSWTVTDDKGRNRQVLPFNDLGQIRPKDRPLYVLGREQSNIPMPKNEKALWSDRAWTWMGDQYARIAREPIFMANYLSNRRALKPMQDQLAQVIAGEGKAISRTDELIARRMVDKQAHDAAYSFSLSYMDNPNNRSILAYKVRNFSRYYRATEDFYRRAGRLAKNYPDAYWKLALTYQILDDSGWTYRDENGDLYFAYPGNQFLQDAISTISGPFLGGSAGIGSIVDPFQLGGKLKSIAPSTDPSQWLVTPSGPIGTLPLTLLFNKFPEMQGIRSLTLGQYSQAGQTGNLAGEILDTILPAGAQRFWNNLGPDERDASMAGAMTGALAISMANGTFDNVNPNEMTLEQLKRNDVYGEVSKSAWSTLLTKMFLGYAAPASPQMYQNSVTDFGRELGISGMNQVWRKLIDKHDGDFAAAFVDWQKIDPSGDLLPFTVSKTKDNPDLLASLTKAKPYREVVEWTRTSEAKDLADRFPDSYLFLAPQVGEFTWDGWAMLKGLGLKVGKDTDAIAIDMFAAKGEQADAKIRADFGAEIAKYDPTIPEQKKIINELDAAMTDARQEVERSNPYWAAKRQEIRLPYMGNRIRDQFNETTDMLNYLDEKNGGLTGVAAAIRDANSVWVEKNSMKAGYSSSTNEGKAARQSIDADLNAALASLGAVDPAVQSYIDTILGNLDWGSLV